MFSYPQCYGRKENKLFRSFYKPISANEYMNYEYTSATMDKVRKRGFRFPVIFDQIEWLLINDDVTALKCEIRVIYPDLYSSKGTRIEPCEPISLEVILGRGETKSGVINNVCEYPEKWSVGWYPRPEALLSVRSEYDQDELYQEHGQFGSPHWVTPDEFLETFEGRFNVYTPKFRYNV